MGGPTELSRRGTTCALVTRPREEAESLAAALAARGVVAVLEPMMEVHYRANPAPDLAGEIVAGDLAGALRARGFTIERSVLYHTRPAAALSPSAVHALRSGMIDFALFFSPRTAAIFLRLADSAGVAGSCRTITALSISAAIDDVLSALSWRDRQVAEKPSQ